VVSAERRHDGGTTGHGTVHVYNARADHEGSVPAHEGAGKSSRLHDSTGVVHVYAPQRDERRHILHGDYREGGNGYVD